MGAVYGPLPSPTPCMMGETHEDAEARMDVWELTD